MPLTRLNSRTASSNRGRRSNDELMIENAAPNKLSLLPSRWALWYDSRDAIKKSVDTEEFKKNLQQLTTYNSLQDFYVSWERTETRVAPDDQATYFVFKEGIEPLWEDPNNIEGGQWVILVQAKPANLQKTMIWWNALVAGMILGNFGCEDDICGASLSLRGWGHMITLWNRNSEDKKAIESVASHLKALFLLPKVPYQKHQKQVEKTQKRIEKERGEDKPTSPPLYFLRTEPKESTETTAIDELKTKKKKSRRGKCNVEKIPPLADPINTAFKLKFKEDCLRYNTQLLEGKGITSPL